MRLVSKLVRLAACWVDWLANLSAHLDRKTRGKISRPLHQLALNSD